jgi:aspergillopepsin I
MFALLKPVAFALLWSLVTCKPASATSWVQVPIKQKFTLGQVAVRSKNSWSHQLRRPYLKYGNNPPAYIEKAIAHYEALSENGTTSVGAESYYDDVEYLINAQVGDLNVTLNLDTGSADLSVFSSPYLGLKADDISWVFSTLQPVSQRVGRPKIYDPKRSGGKALRGHSWNIQYGDGSGFVLSHLPLK